VSLLLTTTQKTNQHKTPKQELEQSTNLYQTKTNITEALFSCILHYPTSKQEFDTSQSHMGLFGFLNQKLEASARLIAAPAKRLLFLIQSQCTFDSTLFSILCYCLNWSWS